MNDVVIVGSGIGGLACGAALSSVGQKVLLLEKHHSIGGYLQGFTRKNWHWNVGTHYIGNLGPSASFSQIMAALTDQQVAFHNLDSCYERIIGNGFTHDILANNDGIYLSSLQREFPKEQKQLAAFFKVLTKLKRHYSLLFSPKLFSGPLKYMAQAINRLLFSKYWHKTLSEILDQYFSDTRLKTILATHCDKTLLHPSETAFLSWVVIQINYLNGACYPAGSGESISKALKKKIETNGGTIRTRSAVRSLRFNRNRVSGVELESGEQLDCLKVVSDIGMIETAEQLMPGGRISERQQMVINRYKPSNAYMTLHIGLKGDIDTLNIQNTNYRVIRDDAYDFQSNPLKPGWRPSNVLISFPSLRDKAHTDSNHHTSEMIIPARFSHFEQWADEPVRHRSETYKRHKQRITEQLIELLEQTFPGIRPFIAFTELSTPVSFGAYTGHKNGAAYGLAGSLGRMTDLNLHPISDLKGLYYTGADALSQGITGAFMSGIFSAVAVSRNFRILGLKPDRR